MTDLLSPQISVQRLGTRIAVREDLARHLRGARLPLVEGPLHYPRLTASGSRRENHQRGRAVSSMAEARRWVSWSRQCQEQSIVGRRPVRARVVREWMWCRSAERWQQSVRHDVERFALDRTKASSCGGTSSQALASAKPITIELANNLW